MKRFLLSLLLITNTALGQGDPAPFVKGQNSSGLGNQASTIFVPNQQSTKINSYQSLIETGNSNLLANPSFEHQTIGTGWTAINGSCASSSGVTVDGLKNCLFTSSGTNWSLSQCSTTNAPRLAGQEMENSVFLGSASTSDPIWVCPGVNGSYPTPSIANGCMQYTNIGNIQQVKNYFLGDSASTSNCIRISGSNSGTTVGIDKAYTGLRTTSEVSGELNTPWASYTPTFTGWGAVSGLTARWKRSGPDLLIDVTVTAGAGTATQLQMSLPIVNGVQLTSSSGIQSGLSIAGNGTQASTAGANPKNILVLKSPSVSYVNFGLDYYGGSIGGNTAIQGNTSGFTSNVKYTFTARIPIAEWQNNINAFSTKCDDPRQCETVFTAQLSAAGVPSAQNTGSSFPWLSGNCTVSTGVYTCPISSAMALTGPMNCTGSAIGTTRIIHYTLGSSNANQVVFTENTPSTTANDIGISINCQKRGADYDNSRITQQIVQMRGVPKVPGASGGIDTFSVSYGGSSTTTNCTTGNCFIDQIGSAVNSIAWTSPAGNYTMNTSKTYSRLKCTITAGSSGAYLVAGGGGPLTCSNCNSLAFRTASLAGSSADSIGTLYCQGAY